MNLIQIFNENGVQMKTKLLLLTIIVIFSSGILQAQEIEKESNYNWQKENVTVIETKKEKLEAEDKIKLIEELRDQDGNIFSVTYDPSVPLEEKVVKKIIELKRTFFEWKTIQIESIRFVPSFDIIEIVIIPKKYEYGQIDYLPYMPAGMLFIYTDTLTYNFRITRENLFIKIKGEYITEDLLGAKINEAIKNPQAYIRKRDPEYFLAKLEQLENSIDKLMSGQVKLKDGNDKLRYGVLTLHNKGFFGGMNLIDKNAIKKIILLKESKPSMTKEEISKSLEKEDIKISSGEIELILNIFLNEFK